MTNSTVQSIQDLGTIAVAAFGEEAVRKAVYGLIVEYEMLLRATESPDHPALVFLDDYRAEFPTETTE